MINCAKESKYIFDVGRKDSLRGEFEGCRPSQINPIEIYKANKPTVNVNLGANFYF